MIQVGKLAPFNQWDQTMLDDLFANRLYPTGLGFVRREGFPPFDTTNGCILIIPGRYWSRRYNQISESISRYEWVLAIRTGDEENELDPYQVYHPNIRWWVQTPKVGFDYESGTRFFGVGYTPAFRNIRRHERICDVFLSAQDTHERRHECFAALADAKGVKMVHRTKSFTGGMDSAEYALWMGSAKVAPAPSGAVSPDSFRLYEALQSHTVPIADDVSPVYDSRGYWQLVHPDAPFPILTNYQDLPGYVADQLKAWPANANRVAAWWMNYKREMSRWLRHDLKELGAL